MNPKARQELRDSLRQVRRDLSADLQALASQALVDCISEQEFYRSASHVAFYQSIDGEIDPKPLLLHALSQGKSCYLPVITQDEPELVSFTPVTGATELVENRWGIAEPPAGSFIVPTNLDLVFVPLVGFDRHCFRLGMGKGFYDRTFGFKIIDRRAKPLLVGLAHECQMTDPIRAESWDVRLDAVVTEEKIYRPDTAQGGMQTD